MTRIIVDIYSLCHRTDKMILRCRNVPLEVYESSNRRMLEAFENQHPALLRRIPTCHEAGASGIAARVLYREYIWITNVRDEHGKS